MKPYTLNELLGRLNALQMRGFGKHIVLVSDDDECNGFHALWNWEASEGCPFTYLNTETNKMEKAPTILIS